MLAVRWRGGCVSDRPIAAGDLVVVVRNMRNPCQCGRSRIFTPIFMVSKISHSTSHCDGCLSIFPLEECAWVEGKNEVYFTYRLKRIPPLDELEGRCTEESLRQPHKEPA